MSVLDDHGHARRGARFVVQVSCIVLALIVAGLWAGATWVVPQRGSVLTVPVALGRDLQVTMWSREKRFIDKEYNHSESVVVDVPLTVNIWAHDRRAVSMQRLGTLHLPTWPLLVIATTLVIFGMWERGLQTFKRRSAKSDTSKEH